MPYSEVSKTATTVFSATSAVVVGLWEARVAVAMVVAVVAVVAVAVAVALAAAAVVVVVVVVVVVAVAAAAAVVAVVAVVVLVVAVEAAVLVVASIAAIVSRAQARPWTHAWLPCRTHRPRRPLPPVPMLLGGATRVAVQWSQWSTAAGSTLPTSVTAVPWWLDLRVPWMPFVAWASGRGQARLGSWGPRAGAKAGAGAVGA